MGRGGQAELGTKMGSGKYGKGARWRVEKRENFHGFSHFFTFYHQDQPRNYAILRIFTGGSLFKNCEGREVKKSLQNAARGPNLCA